MFMYTKIGPARLEITVYIKVLKLKFVICITLLFCSVGSWPSCNFSFLLFVIISQNVYFEVILVYKFSLLITHTTYIQMAIIIILHTKALMEMNNLV